MKYKRHFFAVTLILMLGLCCSFKSWAGWGLDDTNVMEFGLKVSPGSITSEGALLVWGEGDPLPDGQVYTVYHNGKAIDTSRFCFYQTKNMQADEHSEFFVTLSTVRGKILQRSKTVGLRTKSTPDTVNVKDFGALGDGEANDTRNIQTAIDSCPRNGVVVVPKGVFMTGALFVKSHMTLYLEAGAVLRAIVDLKFFPIVNGRFEGVEGKQFASLINGGELYGRGIQDFAIRGEGVIDAEGAKLIKLEEDNPESPAQAKRGRIISINNGERIFLEGVRFLESPAWGVHFVYSYDVTLFNVHVNTNYDPDTKEIYLIHNGDGVALSSTKNVYILASHIISQDDNISIKSGKNQDGWKIARSTDHVRIYDCRFSNGFGVVVGSEMSGNIRDVLINNCVYENTAQLIELKSKYGRGGIIENVTCKNLSLIDTFHQDSRWFRGGICLDIYYGMELQDQHYDETFAVDEAMPLIRDVWFENIQIHRTKGRGVYLCGRPERYLEQVHFKNVRVDSPYPFEARFVDGIALDNVVVKVPDGMEPYVWNQVKDVHQTNSTTPHKKQNKK